MIYVMYTSCFMDDVILQTKVARRRRPAEAQCTCSFGLGYKLCSVIPIAGQRTLKVTAQVATPGRSLRSMTALLMSGTVCSRTLLTQSSTSVYMQTDILNPYSELAEILKKS